MDSLSRPVAAHLDERAFIPFQSAQAGKPVEKTKGRPRLLQPHWAATSIGLIIPQGGIPGSNPGPATNFRPVAQSAGLFSASLSEYRPLRGYKLRTGNLAGCP